MNPIYLDQLQGSGFSNGPPDSVQIVVGRVSNFYNELDDREKQCIKNASQKRKNEFSSGRRVARYALSRLNIKECPILSNGRHPQFPVNYVGSITHSKSLAATVVAPTDEFQGIGIDILRDDSLNAKTSNRILIEHEQQWLRRLDMDHTIRTAFFCTKESIFKAVYPIVGEFLGFQDVCIDMHHSLDQFSGRTMIDRKSSELIATGQGYLHRTESHWLAVFVIPNS